MAPSRQPAISVLTTGTVRIKAAMKRGRRGPGIARRAAMFLPGEWTDPLPIHAWLIEHDEGPMLVDTGEYAEVNDTPFARFDVKPDDEIHHQLAAHGVDPADLRTVVLTHVHVDHADGLARLPGVPALVTDVELRVVRSLEARVTRKLLRQPLPPGFDVQPVSLDDGPAVGAFRSSHPLTGDGRVHLVPAPGHTPGHAAVLVDRADHHVLLCGDASYDVQQLLDRHVDGVCPNAGVALATIDTILEHARSHPTVILPSHDPDGARRLEAVEVTRPD
jgi:glyoxylase-like metal-dependent hydrolase (beta-lactamase superfamily II)